MRRKQSAANAPLTSNQTGGHTKQCVNVESHRCHVLKAVDDNEILIIFQGQQLIITAYIASFYRLTSRFSLFCPTWYLH